MCNPVGIRERSYYQALHPLRARCDTNVYLLTLNPAYAPQVLADDMSVGFHL